ncbi:T-complex protein 1 subunit beta, partial [Ceratobasidium sp. 370]
MNIFGEEATEERAETARLSSFVGAMAIGDVVKSTLGPKGMNKILQSASTGEVNVTNDGATILKSIQLDNAAAKILVNISKVQDDEIGDGTTSVCVLASELLREGEKLVMAKIHPQTIIEGYRIASAAALKALEASAIDNGSDAEKFRTDLFNIARTTLSSKVLSQDKDYFANLAVDAVLRLRGSTDLEHIQIIKKLGGKLTDSYLDEGFILNKSLAVNSPKRLENAKILIANTSMDTDKIKIFGARVKVDGTGKLAELERAERDKMKSKVQAIAAHGINVFVNRQLIYNYPESLLTEAGIMVIEHADFEGVERLSLVTGGEIASTFDRPELVKLEEAAKKVEGKKAIAVESFARALRQIPTILADNAGYDSSDLVARLRAAHHAGKSESGLDMNAATIGSMRELGITESYKLKRQVVSSASEATEMILRVDTILRATPRKREA